MDRLFEMLENDKNFLFLIFDYQQKSINRVNKNIKIKVPIIFVFGPVGVGKSTISNLIESSNPELFKHIDGDILDLSMKEVLSLSSERNEYTIYKIVEQLIQQKIPVVSIGGGVLLSNKQIPEFKFFNYLNEIFDYSIDIESYILLPMNNDKNELKLLLNDDLLNFKEQCKLYINWLDTQNSKQKTECPIKNHILISLKTIYDDKKIFESAIRTREYNKTQIESIKKATKYNFNIVVRLISLMDYNLKKIIFYPVVNTDNYNLFFSNNLLRHSISDIIRNSFNKNNLFISPKFMQKRLLLEYIIDNKKYINHITLKYDKTKSLSINNLYNNLIEKIVEGHFYKFYLKDDIDKINKILEIILQYDNINEEIEEIIKILKDIIYDFRILEDKRRINKIKGLINKHIKTHNILFPKFNNFISLIIFPDGVFEIPNLSKSAYITVSSLKHSSYKMKEVAKMIKSCNSRDKIIILDDIIYTSNNYIPVYVKFMKIFYI